MQHTFKRGRIECYTPRDFLENWVYSFFDVDLDPSSEAPFKSEQIDIVSGEVFNVKAKTHYYQPKYDGLKLPWFGNVYCNPPYGRGITSRWIEKAVYEYDSYNTDETLLLIPHASSKWMNVLLRDRHIECNMQIRLNFEDGTDDNSPFPTSLFYLGSNWDNFYLHFKKLGSIQVPYNSTKKGLP